MNDLENNKNMKEDEKLTYKFYSLYMKDLLNYRSYVEIFEENEKVNLNENPSPLKKMRLN